MLKQLDLTAIRNNVGRDPEQTAKDAKALLVELGACRESLKVMTHERDVAQLVEVPDANDKHDEVLQLLRDLARPVCVVCECMLVGMVDVHADDPPHCRDCCVDMEEDEQRVTWENETRPQLRRRLELALAGGE